MSFKCLYYFLTVNIGVIVLIVNNCVNASDNDAIQVLVRPTNLWRFLGKNNETLIQRFRENIDEFSVDRIKCLRYCIESKPVDPNEEPHVLNLIWKLGMKDKSEIGSTLIPDNHFKPEIIQGKSFRYDDPRNRLNKCTFSIVIGCAISDDHENNFSKTEKTFIKSLQPNIDTVKDYEGNDSMVENFETCNANEDEFSFSVKPNQREVNVIIIGNVTKIDLKMPIGAHFGTDKTPRLTLATARMPEGLRLNVLNPPPGGWIVKFERVDGECRFAVTSSGFNSLDENDGGDVAEIGDIQNSRNESYFPTQSKIDNNNQSILNDWEVSHEFSARMLSDRRSFEEQEEQKPFNFPGEKNDVEVMSPDVNVTTRMDSDQIEDRVLNRESLELDDLSRTNNDELPIKKHLIVEINPNTNLIANPGTLHRVTYDITNNHIVTVRHYLQARSSPFRVLGIRPVFGFVEIAPGQTVNVAVDIQVPPTIADSVVNTVTLQVQGIEYLEKSAYVHVRTSNARTNDDTRPTIYYYFNNNCALRTNAEKCLKSHWSVDITIQDSGSGLKSVTSFPRGVYPRSQYVSGTSSPVYFYYSSNCCNRIVEVTATDLAGNVYSRRIDVGEWYNLTEGEIAAVVIGVLFIILLIVLIVISMLYCANRRDSHDLPYSQRYGSRSTPRTE